MHIVALAWIYVVLMMAITERTVVAAIMTFLLYGVLPLTIILYLGGATRRRRRAWQARQLAAQENTLAGQPEPAAPEPAHKPEA